MNIFALLVLHYLVPDHRCKPDHTKVIITVQVSFARVYT